MKNDQPVFPGVSRPSSDFKAVRDELRAPPMYIEVDLSAARSLAAGTAQRLRLVGNMIYVDQKANSGYCTLHVQDDASIGNTPITAFPGFLVRVPFTEIFLENVAQPGQVMRLIYGTDLDFVPTIGAGVSVLNAINVNDQVDPVCQILTSLSTLTVGANQVTNILPAASNPRGFVLRNAEQYLQAGGGGGYMSQIVVAAAAAPVALGASQLNAHVLLSDFNQTVNTQVTRNGFSQRKFPAGWGVWAINTIAVAASTQATVRLSLELL